MQSAIQELCPFFVCPFVVDYEGMKGCHHCIWHEVQVCDSNMPWPIISLDVKVSLKYKSRVNQQRGFLQNTTPKLFNPKLHPPT